MKELFRVKSIDRLKEEMEAGTPLHRVLGRFELTSLGIGAVIGAGILVSIGPLARNTAGPALIFSYLLAAGVSALAGLCYAEFAAMAPVAGSAYTYAYATLGEIVAWIIGWDLVLEYAVGSAAVVSGWSGYFQSVLNSLHLTLPEALGRPALRYDAAAAAHYVFARSFNAPALIVSLFVTIVLVRGIRQSARVNAFLVALKIVILLLVIAVGFRFVHAGNYHPLAPYGTSGMLTGAAIAFFSFIGFDSISTHAEEARRPHRDVPFAILASLGICALLYAGVAAVLTGAVPYSRISLTDPVAKMFEQVHLPWMKLPIAAGAVTGITSVLLVMMLSQPRVLLSMARDGFLPSGFFGSIHPRFRTPWKGTIATGLFTGSLAAIFPMDLLLQLVSMGTLMAFAIVCAAVWILRRTHPRLERPFRAPLVPLVPLLGISSCLGLMLTLPLLTWLRLVVWLGIGLLIYFAYGRRHSRTAP